jgi:phosphoglycolate/pyridoxal phosphate phosphatase family enzyme
MKTKNIQNSACFLFDLDGTVYLGDRLLPGAKEILDYLDGINKQYFFLTNNSSRSRDDYLEKLAGHGLHVTRERVISSGMATAIYLKQQNPSAKIYLVGTPSLEKEFIDQGFQLVEEDPDFAVLGFDTTLTYHKLRKLSEFVLEDIPYIATHPDINCPTPEGYMPDIGSMMAMVEASTGRKADLIIGKPFQPMVDAVVSLTGFPPDQLTMVGDRLYTDIAMGAAGIQTVLVLSGETKAKDLSDAPHQPDLVCENLADLLKVLQAKS